MGNAHTDMDDELAVQWMAHLAATPLEQPTTLDPAVIWWKAQLLQRWDHEREATTPIEVGERVQVGIGLAGTIGAIFWLWPTLSAGSSSLPVSILVLAGIAVMGIATASTVSVLRRQ